jgi:hypothetical protein
LYTAVSGTAIRDAGMPRLRKLDLHFGRKSFAQTLHATAAHGGN